MSNACSSSKARISASASACWCVSGADGASSRTPCAREGAQKPSRFLISVEFQLFPFSLRRPKEIPGGEKGGQRPDEGPAEMSALHVDRTVTPTPLPRGEGLETRRLLRSLFVPPLGRSRAARRALRRVEMRPHHARKLHERRPPLR